MLRVAALPGNAADRSGASGEEGGEEVEEVLAGDLAVGVEVGRGVAGEEGVEEVEEVLRVDGAGAVEVAGAGAEVGEPRLAATLRVLCAADDGAAVGCDSAGVEERPAGEVEAVLV